MKKVNLDKYINEKKSMFDDFKEEILFLHKNGATQKSILKFLSDNKIKATASNLSRWLKRQQSKKKKVVSVKIENDERSTNVDEPRKQDTFFPNLPKIKKKGWKQ